MLSSEKISPRDIGLPEPVIRKRRRSRRLAGIMLTIALVTAIAGWSLFGTSIFNAIHIKEESPSLALFAYALLIVSSATLVLGFWYLLLAQMERLARMVEAPETEESAAPTRCAGCHCPCDPADRFCRHCGKSLTA
jgi:Kef-type K+ transport system membrane component KefB